MKKIITVIVAAVLIIAAGITSMLLFNTTKTVGNKLNQQTKDNSDAANNANSWSIIHEMNKGEDVSLSILQQVTNISEDVYSVQILFNQEENKNYSIKNINLSYHISEGDEIISNFYGVGNEEYKQGHVSYKNGVAIECHSDSNYIWCSFVIKSSSAEHLLSRDALDLTYDIEGKFPYSFNKYYDVNPFEN